MNFLSKLLRSEDESNGGHEEKTTLNSNARVAFVDVVRGSLYKLSKELLKYNAKPVLWIGYTNTRHIFKAKDDYPDCIFLDYWRFNKGTSFFSKSGVYAPSLEVMQSIEFFELKDKTIKMMDRQDDLGRFRRLEREALFYSLFFFFYSKVQELKVDLLISAHSPHLPAPMVLYGVCKMLGVNTVHVRESAISPLTYLATDFYGGSLRVSGKVDKTLHSDLICEYIDSFSEESGYGKVEPKYMKDIKERESGGESIKRDDERGSFCYNEISEGADFQDLPSYKVPYKALSIDYLNDAPWVFDKTGSAKKLKSQVRELQVFEYTNISTEVDLEQNFVYFPLHYEPEKTSNPDGGRFYNSYEAIVAVRSVVPVDVPIFLKEHFTQFSTSLNGYLGRSPYFYKSVKSLPNVHFVDIGTDSLSLIKKSLFTVSQTGTACLEAACSGGKGVVLGDVWFSSFCNIYRFEDIKSFDDLMEKDVFSADEVKESACNWVRDYAIPGCITGSFIKYHQSKYGQNSELQDIKTTNRHIAKTLRKHGLV